MKIEKTRGEFMLLVIGGAGYIGSHFVYQGVEEFPVIVLDNLSTGHKNSIHPNAKFIEGDFGNQDILEHIFSSYEIDCVIHFGAKSLVAESVQNPLTYYENNVGKTITLLQMMDRYSIKKLIFSSTAAVYGITDEATITEAHPLNPVNPYGQSKRMVEQIIIDYAKKRDFNYCIFRFFNAAGAHEKSTIGEAHNPETHLIPTLLKGIIQSKTVEIYGQDFKTKDGTVVRDYVHVSDIASAHMKVYEAMLSNLFQSGIYNLGGSRGYSVKEIIHLCQHYTNKQNDIVYCPKREGDPPALVANASKAFEHLGWTPEYSIEDIILSAWQWHLQPKF